MSILNEVKRIFGVTGKSIEEALSNVPEGGAGGVLVTTASFDETTQTVSLDKTWQEIYDAISSGMIGVVRETFPSEVTSYSDTLIASVLYSDQGEDYEVMLNSMNQQIVYKTATADGYPSIVESEGPEGGLA